MKRHTTPRPLELTLTLYRAEAETLITAARLRREELWISARRHAPGKIRLFNRLDNAIGILELAVDDALCARRDEADRRRKEKRCPTP